MDAVRLAEIGQLEKGLPQFFDTGETLSAKRYHSLLAKLQKTRQQRGLLRWRTGLLTGLSASLRAQASKE